MSQIDIRSFLRHQPLFQELSDSQLAALVPCTHEVRGQKGQIIFQKGDPCEGMYLVVYGRVKLSISSAQGAEKVIDDAIALAEGLLVEVVGRVLDRRRTELAALGRDTSKLTSIAAPFARITYDDAAKLLKEKGLPFEWGGDFGSPDETVEDMQATFTFAARLPLDTFAFNRLCVYRGTPLWQEYVKRGLVHEQTDWYKYFKCSEIDPTCLSGEVINHERNAGFRRLFRYKLRHYPLQTFRLLRRFLRFMRFRDVAYLIVKPFLGAGRGPTKNEVLSRAVEHGADFVVRSTLRELVDGMNAIADTHLLDYEAIERLVRSYDEQIASPNATDPQVLAVRAARQGYLGDRLVRVAHEHERHVGPQRADLARVQGGQGPSGIHDRIASSEGLIPSPQHDT